MQFFSFSLVNGCWFKAIFFLILFFLIATSCKIVMYNSDFNSDFGENNLLLHGLMCTDFLPVQYSGNALVLRCNLS